MGTNTLLPLVDENYTLPHTYERRTHEEAHSLAHPRRLLLWNYIRRFDVSFDIACEHDEMHTSIIHS